MNIKIVITFMALLCAGLYISWDLVRTPARTKTSQSDSVINPVVNDFTFSLLSGEARRLYDYQDTVILINFWASWCAPCIEEFPDLVELAQQNPDNFVVLALSVDEQPEQARRFVQTHVSQIPDNFVLGLDHDKAVSQDQFQTTKYPESFLLGWGFMLERKIAGIYDWTSQDFKTYLDTLMRANNPSTP